LPFFNYLQKNSGSISFSTWIYGGASKSSAFGIGSLVSRGIPVGSERAAKLKKSQLSALARHPRYLVVERTRGDNLGYSHGTFFTTFFSLGNAKFLLVGGPHPRKNFSGFLPVNKGGGLS